MENHRSLNEPLSERITSESGGTTRLVKAILLNILSIGKYSQSVPFLWMVLGSVFFISFTVAPGPTGITLVVLMRVLLFEQPDSALQGNINSEIIFTLLSRLFLLFTVLLYLGGMVWDRLGIRLLRGFRRKVIALGLLCVANFFLWNICYSISEIPFNGPRSNWQWMFVISSIALFVTGFWSICVREALNQVERAFLISPSTQQYQR